MYLMIDNYDSFVYNLYAYIRELGEEIQVVRNDKINLADITAINPEGILISPGPGRPDDGGISEKVIQHFAGHIPILGICLGHQIIAHSFGAKIKKGKCPMHGKISTIYNDGQGVFHNLPKTYQVTRYHSLVVQEDDLPKELQVDARSDDGVVMGISHRKYPIYGVQFHPEALLTQYGHELLENFHKICQSYPKNRRYPA